MYFTFYLFSGFICFFINKLSAMALTGKMDLNKAFIFAVAYQDYIKSVFSSRIQHNYFFEFFAL